MFPYGWMAQMRAQQVEAFPEVVTIRRRVLTSDGFGGINDGTPTVVATNVPARITQAQLQSMGGQLQRTLLIEKWTVRVPHDTDLQEEDFIEWGAITLQAEDVKPKSYMTALSCTAELVK